MCVCVPMFRNRWLKLLQGFTWCTVCPVPMCLCMPALLHVSCMPARQARSERRPCPILFTTGQTWYVCVLVFRGVHFGAGDIFTVALTWLGNCAMCADRYQGRAGAGLQGCASYVRLRLHSKSSVCACPLLYDALSLPAGAFLPYHHTLLWLRTRAAMLFTACQGALECLL